jgi:hypothetical protein
MCLNQFCALMHNRRYLGIVVTVLTHIASPCWGQAQPQTQPQVGSISSVRVTPQSSIVSVTSALRRAPAGSTKVVFLSGFEFDIAKYDKVMVASAASRSNPAPNPAVAVMTQSRKERVLVPSPVVTQGAKVVAARLRVVLSAIAKGGASIDVVVVDSVRASITAQVFGATFPYAGMLLADPMISRTLFGQSVGQPAVPVTPLHWSQAVSKHVNAVAFEAHRLAAAESFPHARVMSSSAWAVSQQPAGEAAAQVRAMSQEARTALSKVSAASKLPEWKGSLGYRLNEWPVVFEAARSDPALRGSLFNLDQSAQRGLNAARGLYSRPARLSEIDPSQLDRRYAAAGSNAEQFALAMADCAQSDFVRSAGVDLAVIAAYSNNPEYLRKCLDILSATKDRAPFQRPGWTLYDPGLKLPPGGDGVWLATAWGIDGVVEMLSVLGDRVPADLRSELTQRLRSEVAQIVSDWAQERPWYVKSRAVQSNQWIEPSVGLVKACLFLRDPGLLDAYNLGVQNLAASLARLGGDGAFSEGVSYAAMTSGSLLRVLDDLRLNGDERCHGFAWPRESWKWWAHMVMPGRQFVNCFDSRMSEIPTWAVRNPLPSMMQAAVSSGDPSAMSVYGRLFPGEASSSVSSIRYLTSLSRRATGPTSLPNYAHFESQQVLTWRTAWEPPSGTQSAMALWIRGGTLQDSHSHRDQGQVSVYNGNRIILMDCGMPDYSNPEIESRYAGPAGHGTVQVGALSPHAAPVDVPLVTRRLDESGGEVVINLRPAFPGTVQCDRSVQWSGEGVVEFQDRIKFTNEIAPNTVVLRFHTGAVAPLEITSAADMTEVKWPGVSFRIFGSKVEVMEEQWPDAVRSPYVHRSIAVLCREASTSFDLRSELRFDRSMVERDR